MHPSHPSAWLWDQAGEDLIEVVIEEYPDGTAEAQLWERPTKIFRKGSRIRREIAERLAGPDSPPSEKYAANN